MQKAIVAFVTRNSSLRNTYTQRSTHHTKWASCFQFLTAVRKKESKAEQKRGFGSWTNYSSKSMYTKHIPTSPVQKVLLSVGSALVAFTNPERDDMIAMLGETSGECALKYMHSLMKNDPIGSTILTEKPIVSAATLNLPYLRSLPSSSFGAHYLKYMDERGFAADERAKVQFVDDEELKYVMLRYRQIHDFVHTLASLGSTVPEEIAVKWLEMIQTRLPMCALSAIVGPFSLTLQEQRTLTFGLIPWAVRCAKKSTNIMNIYYEKHFEQDIHEFRRSLNFEPFYQDELTAHHINDKTL